MSSTFNTTTSKAPAAERFPISAISSAVLVVATGMGLVACGGGGGTSSPAPTPVMLSGQAVKGPVTGGQVCAYTLVTPRQQIACATTDANAKYSLALPEGTGEVLIEVTGGTYIDEATGSKVALTTPLRTLSKAGSADNALITPFTELAVQLASASVSNPGGNLSLVGFQTQIGQLETGLGVTGLATGNPFGGKSDADQKYLAALTAFSKQQNGSSKSVGDVLSIMGSQLDKCGISSVNATLSAYGNISLSTTTSSDGGSKLQSLANLVAPAPNKLSAVNIDVDDILPSPCTDTLMIDGQVANFADLANEPKPLTWSTSSKVELTICSSSKLGLQADFPLASLLIHAPVDLIGGNLTLSASGNVNIDTGTLGSGGGITITPGGSILNLPGLPAIEASSKGLMFDTNGCLQPINKGNTTLTGGSSGLQTGGGTIGSGGGSISIGGGGITTAGGTGGSGGGGLVLVGGKSGS